MVDPVCQDLATKAELQELRDQVNALLGQREDGSGTIDVLQAGTLEGTQTFALLALAGTAIQKIVVEGNVGRNILEAIASGAAKFEGIKGNGIRSAIDGLNNLGKGAAKNLDKIKGLGSAVANNAGAIMTVSSLALGIGNSLISIGTLKLIEQDRKNNEFALNALSRDYTSMMNFVSQNRNDIAIAQAANATNQATIQEQQNVNAYQYQQILEAQTQLNSLVNTNREQTQQIANANATLTAYRTQVDELEDDITEFKTDLTNQAIELESALVQAEAINTDQAAMIEYLGRWNNAQQTQIDSLELQINDLVEVSRYWQTEFNDLRQELGLIETPSLLTGSLSKRTIYVTENEASTVGAGAGAAAATAGTVDSQNGILDLASGLAGVSTQVPPITAEDVRGGTSTFNDTLTDLIDQIDISNAVEASDIQSIRDGVKADMESVIPVLLGASVVPSLDLLRTQTSAPAIQQAAAAGVCDSSKPGGCLDTNIKQPLQGQIGNLINAGGTAFSAANNAILSQMQPVLNAVNSTVTTIKNTTNTTLGLVSHADYGLEKIQNYASTAWQAAQGDKIMAGITTALTIHNAMMLSSNLGQTIAEAGNITLSAIGIKDEEGNPFDIGAIVQGKTTEILTNFLGAENYAALTTRIAKINRIYQASVNVLDTTYALFDSARSVQELTASYTGKIGNALKEAGQVYEDAYEEMLETVNPQSAAMRKLETFRNGIDNVEQVVSTVSQISSEVVETRENFQQLKTEKEAWQAEVTTVVEEQVVAREEAHTAVQVSADIDDTDFDPVLAE